MESFTIDLKIDFKTMPNSDDFHKNRLSIVANLALDTVYTQFNFEAAFAYFCATTSTMQLSASEQAKNYLINNYPKSWKN